MLFSLTKYTLFVNYNYAFFENGIRLLSCHICLTILEQKTMDKNFAIYFNHENKMREELMEYVKNISVIKAFAKEEEISERTLKTAREYIYWD